MTEKNHPTPCLAAAVMSPVPSTSKVANSEARIQRNVAEKQRRDKLNGYISELANIVPMVSMSSRRLDKTSILRLSAAHLRICKSSLGGSRKHKRGFKWCPSFLSEDQVRDILESVDGFLLVTTSSGKVLFTSRSVERYLGHQDIDLIGHSLFTFIHPDDLDTVKDETEKVFLAAKENDQSQHRCSFRCRMREKGQPRSEVVTYQYVHFVGAVTASEEASEENGCKSVVSYMFKAFVKVVDISPYNQLSLEEATADEYVTRHSLDGTIIFADHRLATITGHMPHEVVGLSAYAYIHSADTAVALFAHHLMFSNDKGTGMIVYRLRTRNDKFVYLKSVGCLQFDAATSQVDHFVCVNQHLSDSDGDLQLKYFVDRFIPHIKGSSTSSLFESVKALQTSSGKPLPSTNGTARADSSSFKCQENESINSAASKVRNPNVANQESKKCSEKQIGIVELGSKSLHQDGSKSLNLTSPPNGLLKVNPGPTQDNKPFSELPSTGANVSYAISPSDAEFFSKTIHKTSTDDVDTIYVSSLDTTLNVYKNSTSSSVKGEMASHVVENSFISKTAKLSPKGMSMVENKPIAATTKLSKLGPDFVSADNSSESKSQFRERNFGNDSNVEILRNAHDTARNQFTDASEDTIESSVHIHSLYRDSVACNSPFPVEYMSKDVSHATNHLSFVKSEGLNNAQLPLSTRDSVEVLKNAMWSVENEELKEDVSNLSMDVCESLEYSEHSKEIKDAFQEDFSLIGETMSQEDSSSSANGWNDVFSFTNYQSPLSNDALLPFEDEQLSINNPNVKSYDLW